MPKYGAVKKKTNLSIGTEGPISEHFKHRVMSSVKAHVIQVIKPATDADAWLWVGRFAKSEELRSVTPMIPRIAHK